MMRLFHTKKPTDSLKEYISYYYLDVASDNAYYNEYICYPHYNNTISIYQSHEVVFKDGHSNISYNRNAQPLQIFTPVREEVLKVTQRGPVYKIGIVFHAFGINQFLKNDIDLSIRHCSPSFAFLTTESLTRLFRSLDMGEIAATLDDIFLELLNPLQNSYVQTTIRLLHEQCDLNIDKMALSKLGITRKHLNRLFKKYIGTTVQKYRFIVRFRQLMDYKMQQNSSQNLTALSNEAHYADQSHFIKACKQLTGLTPSRFFKEGRLIGSEDTYWKFLR